MGVPPSLLITLVPLPHHLLHLRSPLCSATSNPPIPPPSTPFPPAFSASDATWALHRSLNYRPAACRRIAVTRTVDDRRRHHLQTDGEAEEEGKEHEEHELRTEYADWTSRLFEDASKNDEEIREMISESFGDPEELRRRIQARIQKKGRDILQPKTGSAFPLKVSFKDFDPMDGYIWLELYNAPSDKDIDIIGSVIRSWFLLGQLGGFDSLNIQGRKYYI
eukprot:c19383_g1_i1 orf=428-1090(-)